MEEIIENLLIIKPNEWSAIRSIKRPLDNTKAWKTVTEVSEKITREHILSRSLFGNLIKILSIRVELQSSILLGRVIVGIKLLHNITLV